MGWLIAAGCLLVLGLLPLTIRLAYDSTGARVLLGVGPVRFPVFPTQKQKKIENSQCTKTQKQQKKSENTGGKLSDFLPLMENILTLVAELRRRIVVTDLYLKIRMTGDDPCDLSIQYGRTWAALGNLVPHLDRLFVIKKRNFDIQCDYTSDDSSVFAHAVLRITLGRLLWITIFHGSHILKQYFEIYNKRKGGKDI